MLNNAVEIVGKVQGDLSVKVFQATDFGGNIGMSSIFYLFSCPVGPSPLWYLYRLPRYAHSSVFTSPSPNIEEYRLTVGYRRGGRLRRCGCGG